MIAAATAESRKPDAMKRRAFLKTAAAGIAGSSLLAGCGGGANETGDAPGARTRPQVRWRLISSYPRALDTIFGVSEEAARRVAALTEGRFQIQVFPPGELAPATEVLGAVQKGAVEMGHSASYYYTGHHPALVFDTGTPFGLSSRQQTAWLRHGGGLELIRSIYADFNIINFPGGNTGAQMGGWFRREINTLEDLQGLKMRIPGLGGQVMNELGVTVQLIAGGELYQALERGALDAAEWGGPHDDMRLGFHEIAPYYYYPGWWEPGPGVSFMVNRDAWDALPSAYQEALAAATAEAGLRMLARYDARNQEAFREMREENAIRIRPFSREMMQEAERITMDLIESDAAQDPAYRQVYDSFRAFREDAYAWFAASEHAFASFAYPRAIS